MLSVRPVGKPVTADPRTVPGAVAADVAVAATTPGPGTPAQSFPPVSDGAIQPLPRSAGDRSTGASPRDDGRRGSNGRPAPRSSPGSTFAAQLLAQQPTPAGTAPQRCPYAVAAYQAASSRQNAASDGAATRDTIDLHHPDLPVPLASGHFLDLVV